MATNERTTRVVRTCAMDLAIGDVIIDYQTGDWAGNVDSVPIKAAGMVTFHLNTDDGVRVKTWKDTRVVRIEIERRTS